MEQTKDTIVAKAYDLIKYALPILNKMPKDQRYLLGDRIQTMLGDLLERLLEAYYAATHQKRELLIKTNLLLEKLRYFFRLGYDTYGKLQNTLFAKNLTTNNI